MQRSRALRSLLVIATLLLLSCTAEPQPLRVILLGIDGGEWRVIEEMWSEGKLPHLRAMADSGASAPLQTAYGASPVIWTTIATGVAPQVHGIRDFVEPTERGDVPVSSSTRKVPALWNMLTKLGRRTAVFNWWASWPAEEVDGIVISDRSVDARERRTWPPELAERVSTIAREQQQLLAPGNHSEIPLQDRVLTQLVSELELAEFDLTLLYLRGPDLASHFHWKSFDPEPFGLADDRPSGREHIEEAYGLVDEVVGGLRSRLDERTVLFVVSDHGFRAETEIDTRIRLDFDVLLERLGLLERNEQGVDLSKTAVYSYAHRPGDRTIKVRFSLTGREAGGSVRPRDRAEVRNRLERELARIRYSSGSQVFHVRDARGNEKRRGADFVVRVLAEGATRELVRSDDPSSASQLDGVVAWIRELSGGHDADTAGVFFVEGPGIASAPELEGIHIHDLAPTVLYALGLPVADDFVGRAWTELFVEERALHRIESWGARTATGDVADPEQEQKLLEQLESLGYLN